MKTFRLSVCALALTCALRAFAAAELPAGDWQMTFHDEFDGSGLNLHKWTRRFPWGEAVINNELQAYADDAFEASNGILRIKAERRSGQYAGQTLNYTSGIMTTGAGKFSQKYGYFEIRCRMPNGQGFWPAFWMLAENAPGVNEVDIFEHLGREPNTVHMTTHWGTDYGAGHRQLSSSYTASDFTADFHTFGLEWTAQELIFYVDGAERFRVTGEGVPQVEEYLIANLAVGGWWAWEPAPETVFPNSLEIDYIRAYQRGLDVAPPALLYATGGSAPGQLIATFSESLDQASAEIAGNYALNGVAPASAQLQPNDKTVLLTFAPLQRGGNYTLTAGNVRDLNSNAVAAGSQHTFVYAAPGDGLQAAYFNDPVLSNAVFTRVDPAVDFAWLGGTPGAGLPPDGFSTRWTGKVLPRFTETYTFTTLTDDGVRLWVNGQLLVDRWVNQGPTEHSGAIALAAGSKVDVRMEYFEATGDATAKLFWSSPRQPREIVPQSQLYTLDTASPTVSISTPAANAIVGGVITISGTAADAELANVEVKVGTHPYGPATGLESWSYVFDTRTLPNAQQGIFARATDAAGNVRVATRAVIVNNGDVTPPGVTVTAPPAGSVVSGNVVVRATATDNVGVARVEFFIDGVRRLTDTTAPYAYTWPTGGFAKGAHQVMARAFDAGGRSAQHAITVYVRQRTGAPGFANDVRVEGEAHPAAAAQIGDLSAIPAVVAVPAGALPWPVQIHLEREDASDADAALRRVDEEYKAIKRVTPALQLNAQRASDQVAVTRFDRPFTLTFTLDRAALAAPNLAVFFWNEKAQSWHRLPGEKVDRSNGTLSVETDAPALFAVFALPADPAADALEPFAFQEVYAFPNPATEGRVTLHVEAGSADSVAIRIYDVTGARIHEARLSASSASRVNGKTAYEYVWDLSGAASGTYLYAVEASKGGQTIRTTKKFSVVK